MSETRKDLAALMESQGLSQSHVAKALGLSGATVSQYLTGAYPGNISKVDESVNAFLARCREKKQIAKFSIPFVNTSVSKKIFEGARTCHTDCEMGICYGNAGIGKTISFKEYAARNPSVIFIEADLGYTSRDLFRELHKRLGMDARGTIHDMFDDCVAKLRNSERLIIVDEAEHLPYRALDLLRRVYDKAGVGIFLGGMPRLKANLVGKRGEYAQLSSRISMTVNLQSLNEHDTEEIVKAVLPLNKGIHQTFHAVSKGNARVLEKFLRRSIRLAEKNNCTISEDIIKSAAEYLLL